MTRPALLPLTLGLGLCLTSFVLAAPSYQGITQGQATSTGASATDPRTPSPEIQAGDPEAWMGFLARFHGGSEVRAGILIEQEAFLQAIEKAYLERYDVAPQDGKLSPEELATAQSEFAALRAHPLLQVLAEGPADPSNPAFLERYDVSPRDGTLSPAEISAASDERLALQTNPAAWMALHVDEDASGSLEPHEIRNTYHRLMTTVPGGHRGFGLPVEGFYKGMSQSMDQLADAPWRHRDLGKIDYVEQVKPIIERNCVACHACYDAPCQLKMSSDEGLERGATKEKVYDAARLEYMVPTRIFLDAMSTEAWQEGSFYSVTDKGLGSLMARMIELGRKRSLAPNQKLPVEIKLGLAHEETCPKLEEFEQYAEDRPEEGMPFAVTGLRPDEYQVLEAWMAQGAEISEPPVEILPEHQALVDAWETYLNGKSRERQLIARYLYEHLFLAHLYFDGPESTRFYELVRSITPPGQPVIPVETRTHGNRPNTDPGGSFSYRIRPLESTVVHKTHITYPFDAAKLQRVRQLFRGDWQAGQLPSYDDEAAIHPFRTFQAIPAESRYRFLLDDSQYFVRTFIKGPVCRGNTATDVIQDHFFAFFLAPEEDRFVQDPAYAEAQLANLGIPALDASNGWSGPLWGLRSYLAYAQGRREAYQGRPRNWDDLWDGEGSNRDALLTIFRHHDSATVTQGLLGIPPKTAWVIDYPLLERIYYQLVANFDVFGPLLHQVDTRISFDRMRVEGETTFFEFMPAELREDLRKSWYKGYLAGAKVRRVYADLDTETPSEIEFASKNVGTLVESFMNQVLERMPKIAGEPDLLNRCPQVPCAVPGQSRAQQEVEAQLQRLAGVRAEEAPGIGLLPELTFLRFESGSDEPDFAYTLTHDRSLKNSAFMAKSKGIEVFGTTGAFEPDRDNVTVARGPLGSYPNFIFYVPAGRARDFVDFFLQIKDEEGLAILVEAFGIRRMHPDIWDHFHFFTEHMQRVDPLEAGLFDMNRYANF